MFRFLFAEAMEHPVLRRSEKYVHSMFLDPAYLGHAVIQSHSGLEDLEDLEGEVPQQRSFCCDSTISMSELVPKTGWPTVFIAKKK